MQNYAKGQPVGNNQVPLYDCPPPVKAVGNFYVENGSTSSVVTLSQNTTAIEIANTSANRAVLMRWVLASDTQASVTSSNFDHAIPANTVRRFVVPIETGVNQTTGATTTSFVGANIEYGLFRRVAWISQGPASIISAEYGSSNSY